MLQQQLNELLLPRAPKGTRSADRHSACPLNSCAELPLWPLRSTCCAHPFLVI